MSGFDRSKYKPTPIAALQAQDADHETKRPSQGNSRAGYLEIKLGDNKYRIFPCHPDGGGKTYSETKCVSFLTIEKQVYEDGKAVEGKTELKRAPVFNGKVHGNLPVDLVEAYLKVAKEKAIPAYTEDQKHRDKIWGHITGFAGIKPIDSWVVYASKFEGGVWGPIGFLEFKKTVKTQLQDLAMEFVGNNPVSPDPFTDTNEGIAIVINKSGEGIKTEYSTKFSKIGLGKDAKFDEVPLTDEQLEAFEKLDPLHKIYANVFAHKDLKLQLEGLLNYDQELTKGFKDKEGNKFTADIGVFQYEEFQAVVDQLLDLVPEVEVKEEIGGGTADDNEEHEEEVKEPIVIKSSPRVAPKTEVKKTVAASPAPKKVEEVKQAPTSTAGMSLKERMDKIKAGLGKN